MSKVDVSASMVVGSSLVVPSPYAVTDKVGIWILVYSATNGYLEEISSLIVTHVYPLMPYVAHFRNI